MWYWHHCNKVHLKYRMMATKTSAAPTQDTTVTCTQHSQRIKTYIAHAWHVRCQMDTR
jgi:hypothetical protein